MPAVSSYSILFYGGPGGYQTNRAQNQLSDAAGKTWPGYDSTIPVCSMKPTRTTEGSSRRISPRLCFIVSPTFCATKNPLMSTLRKVVDSWGLRANLSGKVSRGEETLAAGAASRGAARAYR